MVPVASAVYAVCCSTIPRKPKFGICVVPEELLFFLFNSVHKNPATAHAAIQVSPDQAPFLKKACFLDTGLLLPFALDDIDFAIRKGKVWPVPHDLRETIKGKVSFHGILARKYENLVLQNF
jgi:hypothetical protein